MPAYLQVDVCSNRQYPAAVFQQHPVRREIMCPARLARFTGAAEFDCQVYRMPLA